MILSFSWLKWGKFLPHNQNGLSHSLFYSAISQNHSEGWLLPHLIKAVFLNKIVTLASYHQLGLDWRETVRRWRQHHAAHQLMKVQINRTATTLMSKYLHAETVAGTWIINNGTRGRRRVDHCYFNDTCKSKIVTICFGEAETWQQITCNIYCPIRTSLSVTLKSGSICSKLLPDERENSSGWVACRRSNSLLLPGICSGSHDFHHTVYGHFSKISYSYWLSVEFDVKSLHQGFWFLNSAL